MNLLTCDWETYYDRDYSLSKLTTEEYVRHANFEPIGISVKVNSDPAVWYSGDDFRGFLSQYDWENSAVLCHNTVFDGAIFGWHFGIKPRMWLDTLSMARPFYAVKVGLSLAALARHYDLGEKGTEVVDAYGIHKNEFSPTKLAAYGAYCVNDVELTYKLFHKMKSMFSTKELMVIDQTLRMYTEPVIELDKPTLHAHLADVVAKRDKFLKDTADADGMTVEEVRKALMSNPKFAAKLEALGVQPPMKISHRTGKPAYAFAKSDQDFLDLLEDSDEAVASLVAARLGVKSTIEETRTNRMLNIADRGPLPVLLQYYAAHTGRFGGGDKMNLQNLPRGTPDKPGKLRSALRAPKGKVFVACDSSQIEARTLAWLAGQTDLLDDFRLNRDPYSKFATQIYGIPVNKSMKVERFVGKTCILGLGYGMGKDKLARTLEIGQGGISVKVSASDAESYVKVYRDNNRKIVNLWYRASEALRHMVRGSSYEIGKLNLRCAGDNIYLPNGMRITYAGLNQNTHNDQYRYIGSKDGRHWTKLTAAKMMPNKAEADAILNSVKWTYIYGGKVIENCLAAGTKVLTNSGWKAIEAVTLSDKLWDGKEWVVHDGLINQGKQFTTVVDGVRMTPDHKVLTASGWVNASSCEGHSRADFRMPDGTEVHGEQQPPLRVGVPLRMWNVSAAGRNGRDEVRSEGRNPELRLYARSEEPDARHVEASSIRGMAEHGGSLHAAYAPSVEEVWGERDYSLLSVASQLRSVLDGHGAYLPAGAYARPDGQQRAVLSGELSLGYIPDADYEPAQQSAGGFARSLGSAEDQSEYVVLPLEERTVYDIRNAGPRTRFMVLGDNGPLIVHNCVQALARIIVAEQMVAIGQRYKVVLQVHDEIVIVVDEDEAEEARAFMEQVMRTPPDWGRDLPVDCESGVGHSYGEAK